MRIAHVTDGYLPRLGGIETQVHDLALGQLRAGHDVEIVTATPGTAADGLVVHRPAEGRDRSSGGAGIGPGTDRALVGGYDVLHVHLSIASPLALSVLWHAAGERRPVVATMHSLWGSAEPALAAGRRVLGGRTGRVTWTAVSSAAARPLRRSLGVPVTVVPNGVDVTWWAGSDRRSTGPGLRAVSVMRLSRRKRPLPLVRMMGAADRASPGSPVSLTVIGDGRQAPRLSREARRHDQIAVTLTGRLSRPEIRDALGGHDVYIAPAPLESFGLAALEARSAGLPVLAYRHSGVADFIRDGWDGLLVDDDAGLTEAVTQLARHHDVLRRLQANARGSVPDLGWPTTLAAYECAYGTARTGPLAVPHRGVLA